MKDFLNWLHHHPIKACGFTCLFTMAFCLLADDAVDPLVGGGVWGFGLLLWIATFLHDTGKDWGKE